jgi:hypothetical protein
MPAPIVSHSPSPANPCTHNRATPCALLPHNLATHCKLLPSRGVTGGTANTHHPHFHAKNPNLAAHCQFINPFRPSITRDGSPTPPAITHDASPTHGPSAPNPGTSDSPTPWPLAIVPWSFLLLPPTKMRAPMTTFCALPPLATYIGPSLTPTPPRLVVPSCRRGSF